jgi:hypothetical protein
MRNTFRQTGRSRAGGRSSASAAQVSAGASLPAPTGGWDAINPLSSMPPQNAWGLVNWFPQPGYVELRRGFVNQCDTGTELPVETVMGFQGQRLVDRTLIAASAGELFDVTTSTAASIGSGFSNDRWQSANFSTTGGSFLWMCNGEDVPQYWDGSALAAATITGVTPEDIIYVCAYRERLWFVLKDSDKAAYLDVNSIQGAATEFPLETFFVNGGNLVAIGTWATDTNDGPNEFIAFFSSFGDIAIFQISDPGEASGIAYKGTATVGSLIGQRPLCKIGSDLAAITIDGVLPISQVLSYDRGALLNVALTKNIKQAMTEAAQRYKNNFGWQLTSYPRSNMAILNVPVGENSAQQQYVMNTLTGAWAQFEGQAANCWCVFDDRAYFGGNDGIVRLADESFGDEDQTFSATMDCAFNYYGVRGLEKRWTMVRPAMTIDTTIVALPEIGLNVNFGTGAETYDLAFGDLAPLSLWNSAIWGPDADEGYWPGVTTSTGWTGIAGTGYCSSIKMVVEVPWSEDQRAPKTLQVNAFDMVWAPGGIV